MFPNTTVIRLIMRKNMKNRAVTGSAENNSFNAFTKAFRNQRSIENTAFNIYRKKLMDLFMAIDKIDTIS